MSLSSRPGRGAVCGDQAGRAWGVGAAAASPAAPLTRVRGERGLWPLGCPWASLQQPWSEAPRAASRPEVAASPGEGAWWCAGAEL